MFVRKVASVGPEPRKHLIQLFGEGFIVFFFPDVKCAVSKSVTVVMPEKRCLRLRARKISKSPFDVIPYFLLYFSSTLTHELLDFFKKSFLAYFKNHACLYSFHI